MGVQKSSKPLKEKTTKAERRALKEAQRAASKGASLDVFILALHVGIISCLYCVLSAEGGKAPLVSSGSVASANVKAAKPARKIERKMLHTPACSMTTRVES